MQAIVGGCIPIAMGVAWEIKRRGGCETAWLAIGDMAAQSGVAHECIKYAHLNDLPLKVILEDNDKSVCGDTKTIWGGHGDCGWLPDYYYKFTLPYPHAGAGKRVQF